MGDSSEPALEAVPVAGAAAWVASFEAEPEPAEEVEEEVQKSWAAAVHMETWAVVVAGPGRTCQHSQMLWDHMVRA